MYVAVLNEQVLGERLGHDVRDAQSRVLLRQGTTLTPQYIEMLKRRGFRSVPVGDPLAPEAVPQEVLREHTRTAAQAAVAQCLARQGQGEGSFAAAAAAVVQRILADVFASPRLFYHVASLRSVQEDILVHSVNVCAYSVILGSALDLPADDLRDLGIGALLHDVGKIYHMDLVDKPGRLTPEEFERLHNHAWDGFSLLRQDAELNLLSAHIALQHHERLDGSGYPRGLRAHQIHPWAKVVAIADIYDALTADRAYGSAQTAAAALDEVRRLAQEGKLDAPLVDQLALRLSVFPAGTILLLHSHELCVVVGEAVEATDPLRVRMVTDSQWRLVPAGERLVTAPSVRGVLRSYPRPVREELRQITGS